MMPVEHAGDSPSIMRTVSVYGVSERST
jgi:hypothetical protein